MASAPKAEPTTVGDTGGRAQLVMSGGTLAALLPLVVVLAADLWVYQP
jgi:hypothetical protein